MVKAPRIRRGRRRKTKRLGLNCRTDAALDLLLRKIFALMWERGRAADATRTFVSVELGGTVEIACFVREDGVIDVTIYAFVGADWDKVFSAYITEHPLGAQYRFWGRRCWIHHWKRGDWELFVSSQAVTPRSLSDGMTAGRAPRAGAA